LQISQRGSRRRRSSVAGLCASGRRPPRKPISTHDMGPLACGGDLFVSAARCDPPRMQRRSRAKIHGMTIRAINGRTSIYSVFWSFSANRNLMREKINI
jgi:hypothetical protein